MPCQTKNITTLGPKCADDYHDISYRDNLALSYRIDSQYFAFKIIKSNIHHLSSNLLYQFLIICL